MGEIAPVELLTLLLTTVGSSVVVTSYLSRQIDRKINMTDYEAKHGALEERVRRLEVEMAGYMDSHTRHGRN